MALKPPGTIDIHCHLQFSQDLCVLCMCSFFLFAPVVSCFVLFSFAVENGKFIWLIEQRWYRAWETSETIGIHKRALIWLKKSPSHSCLCIQKLRMNYAPNMHKCLLSHWLFVLNAEHDWSNPPSTPFFPSLPQGHCWSLYWPCLGSPKTALYWKY